MSGFKISPEALETFSNHLGKVEDTLRASGEVAGGCVGDPGIFGIGVGQILGAGASMHCDKARDQLNAYADTIVDWDDKVKKAAANYKEGDFNAETTISEFQL